ncbi:hypothetical protein PENTCL1PPCAC_25126, partial [Pristionchus entomophagus]
MKKKLIIYHYYLLLLLGAGKGLGVAFIGGMQEGTFESIRAEAFLEDVAAMLGLPLDVEGMGDRHGGVQQRARSGE